MDAAGAWSPDTGPRRRGCAPADLLAAVRDVHERYPAARLVRNAVGNLAVVVGGDPVGFLDLTFGRFIEFTDASDGR